MASFSAPPEQQYIICPSCNGSGVISKNSQSSKSKYNYYSKRYTPNTDITITMNLESDEKKCSLCEGHGRLKTFPAGEVLEKEICPCCGNVIKNRNENKNVSSSNVGNSNGYDPMGSNYNTFINSQSERENNSNSEDENKKVAPLIINKSGDPRSPSPRWISRKGGSMTHLNNVPQARTTPKTTGKKVEGLKRKNRSKKKKKKVNAYKK